MRDVDGPVPNVSSCGGIGKVVSEMNFGNLQLTVRVECQPAWHEVARRLFTDDRRHAELRWTCRYCTHASFLLRDAVGACAHARRHRLILEELSDVVV